MTPDRNQAEEPVGLAGNKEAERVRARADLGECPLMVLIQYEPRAIDRGPRREVERHRRVERGPRILRRIAVGRQEWGEERDRVERDQDNTPCHGEPVLLQLAPRQAAGRERRKEHPGRAPGQELSPGATITRLYRSRRGRLDGRV